jgi:hypothetical protein
MMQGESPELGTRVVALAMAVILGKIIGGPVLLGHALAAAGGTSREASEAPDE